MHQSRCLLPEGTEKDLTLRIILDRYSAEVFVGDGERVMTTTIYTEQSADDIALDIDGEVTAERLDLLRNADQIFRRLIEQSNQARRLSAYYASLSAVGSVYTVTLHALAASDLGLSRAARIPYDILESVTEQIRQELPRIRHVTYDLTPHMTI